MSTWEAILLYVVVGMGNLLVHGRWIKYSSSSYGFINGGLAGINIGSSVAFTAIIPLTVAAILSSYIISISCILLKL